MEDSFFDQFDAKSDGTTLEQHTRHVIQAGKNLLDRLPFSIEEKNYWSDKLHRCAVLHDLGKIHSDFQNRLKGDRNVSIRHEIISLWFCENFLELDDDELFAIATHHKGIIPHLPAFKRLELDNLKVEMENHYEKDPELLTFEVVQNWVGLFNLKIKTNQQNEPNKQISSPQIKKLFQTYQNKLIPEARDRKKLSLMRALLIASDHIGSARQEETIPFYSAISIQDFQPKDKGGYLLSFRSFQKKLQSETSDIILHAPTGSGKTEAALSWVYANQVENARLFYLLPYTASINAMVTRLQMVFGQERVTALHSKTLDFFFEQLADEEDNEGKDNEFYERIQKEAKTKKSLSSEIYYPVKVATLHQILKTSLKGKGWEFALFDYKNALFIIDEFHTYDALLTGLMLASIKLFKRLFNARFFFMSATIPEFMLQIILKEIFNNDVSKLIRPNIEEPSDAEILDRKRHQLNLYHKQEITGFIKQIEQYLASGKSVLIIVNNVKTCQKIYNDMSEVNSVTLLHSGFHKRSRIEIEKKITHRNEELRPKLLIATQAVEVSLDIDYDVAFIENAPIDALIQRFGRVNRAGKKGIVQIFLCELSVGNTPFYDNDILLSTWAELTKFNKKELSENDLITICNKVYEKGYTESQLQDFNRGLDNSTIAAFEEDWIAGHWENWVEEAIENDNKKVEVLCGNLVHEFDELKSQGRYIEANQLLVQVYFYELTSLSKDEKRGVLIDNNLVYDNIIGYTKKIDKSEDRIW